MSSPDNPSGTTQSCIDFKPTATCFSTDRCYTWYVLGPSTPFSTKALHCITLLCYGIRKKERKLTPSFGICSSSDSPYCWWQTWVADNSPTLKWFDCVTTSIPDATFLAATITAVPANSPSVHISRPFSPSCGLTPLSLHRPPPPKAR